MSCFCELFALKGIVLHFLLIARSSLQTYKDKHTGLDLGDIVLK